MELQGDYALKHAENKSLRLHLMGHSFGALLVSAAANALDSRLASLFLMQGAFSHSSFTETVPLANHRRGRFRDVIDKKRVAGPIAVTWSKNDNAFQDGWPMYPWQSEQHGHDGTEQSRLAKSGGRLPQWGAMGGAAESQGRRGGAQNIEAR